ncbi:MAG: hypothetical protein E3J66_05430, partial [Dehalococcoidia bacterium]
MTAFHRSLRVGDNLYCYIWEGMGNNCNAAFFPDVLRGERSHVLVEPGHIRKEVGGGCFASLPEAVEQDGFWVEGV